ncbi:hypothetical protein CEE37_07720 [candidate division LCP-89 bacterium B3_LCP]|uniref:Secretion system C-terminal sorting domain-containing protein n=1 Tax=candidate division LCP-89 bacterium B3_LCP TaxID=2012998 RepID=A0A532V0W4_UNCL8|nr:MAG: hypothetical protein CEE37_07720 [candidate division LCP-89 bacterium B3_LCP]
MTGGVMYKKILTLALLGGLMMVMALTAHSQIIFTIQYDDGTSAYYSGRPLPGDTCGVWFEPPTESKIISTEFNFNDGMGGDAQLFIWAMADGFDPADYYDNNEPGWPWGSGNSAPSPLGEILAGPITYPFDNSGNPQVVVFEDWGYPPDALDIGTDPFFVGYVLLGGGGEPYYPSILGDAADDHPYHSLCWLTTPGGNYVGESGWWAYGIDWLIRTDVDMYGDPPPVIVGIVDPPDTYTAGPYEITATITDQIAGGDPGVVDFANLIYSVDGGDEQTVAMTNVGDEYSGEIPAQAVGSMINFRVEAEDNTGHPALAPGPGGYNFSYLEPSGAKILLVNDTGGRYDGIVYTNALASNGYDYDYWLIDGGSPDDQGYPGDDVVNTTNYNSIVWFNGTANSGSLPLNEDDLTEDPVANFMDDGGSFFFSSSDYLGGAFGGSGHWTEFTAEPGWFMYDYLWVADGWSDATTVDTMYTGVDGDPVSGDWFGTFIKDSPDPNYNDWAWPVSPATTCFWTEDDESAATRYDGPYKMVFLAWVLEDLVSYNVAEGILVNTLNWFGEGTVKLVEGSRYGIEGTMPQDILATITDGDGVTDAMIHGIKDGTINFEASLVSAGGDQYTFSFPQPITTSLEYWLTAEDLLGNPMSTPHYECWTTTFTGTGADVLFCSDQLYSSIDYDSTITDALDALAVTYDIWDVDENGAPDYWTVLSNYDNCFWVGFGDYEASVFPPNTVDNPFTNFLRQGKNLLYSSEEMIGYVWGSVNFATGNFAYDWLHIGGVTSDVSYSSLQITADPICAGLTVPLELSGYDPGVGNWSDYYITTNPTATEGLFFTSPGTAVGDPCGHRDDVDQHNSIALGFCLFMMDTDNTETFLSNVLDYFGNNPGTGVEPENKVVQPLTYELQQNFPNPFNPVTQIRFAIPENTKVELTIYNLMGQEVAKLVDRNLNAGYHSVSWDGAQFASGIYFYKIKTANFEQAQKMILVK